MIVFVQVVLWPHALGTPPPPQVSGAVHDPHESVLPQLSDGLPQVARSDAHVVVGAHAQVGPVHPESALVASPSPVVDPSVAPGESGPAAVSATGPSTPSPVSIEASGLVSSGIRVSDAPSAASGPGGGRVPEAAASSGRT